MPFGSIRRLILASKAPSNHCYRNNNQQLQSSVKYETMRILQPYEHRSVIFRVTQPAI